MKKVCLLVLLSVTFLSAQQNNKGNISLIYNGEKIDLPINTITMHKESVLSIGIEATQSDSAARETISLELALNELSSEPNVERLEGTEIKVITLNKSADTGKEFYILLSDDKGKSEAYYGIKNREEKITWGITSVSFKVNITDIKYIKAALHISGEFSGTFKSKDAPEGQIAEIKDGRFEIII